MVKVQVSKFNKIKSVQPQRGIKERNLYFNAVEESHSAVVTAADAIVTIIEDPLLSILKEDPNITHSAGQIGGLCFEHDPTSPRLKLLMKHLIPNSKVCMLVTLRLLSGRRLRSFLRKVSHR